MTPCVHNTESSARVFLVGKLKTKSTCERKFYEQAYKALHKVQIGRRNFTENNKEICECDLFQESPGEDCKQQQTYIQWRSAMEVDLLTRLMARWKTTIYIQPISCIPQTITNFILDIDHRQLPLLDILKSFAEIFFLTKQVSVLPVIKIAETGWKITERKSKLTGEPQLLVRDFFCYLRKCLPRDGLCIMGISWTDLYPTDKLNYVLGESSYADKSGVFSFGRFDMKREDGSSGDRPVQVDGPMLWQLLKTLTHEVCHLMKLDHCSFFQCTMNASHTVKEAMDQPLFLCPVCMRKLQKVCHFNLTERYNKLLSFLSQVNLQFPYIKFTESIQWLENVLRFLQEQQHE